MSASLAAAASEDAVITVHEDKVLHPVSRYLTGACIEDVNHEIYGGLYSQMVFGESFQEPPGPDGVSKMWRAARSGSASGQFSVETNQPFVGAQCQRMAFMGGAGEAGIENQGLNRWGMSFVQGRQYEGCVDARADVPAVITVALESADGARVCAEQNLSVSGPGWQHLDFVLTSSASDSRGRFSIKLKQPGSVDIGYAFLQPGEWGRFKGLPVRRDVAEGLVDQGITVLRYGGSMVNAPAYRWKKMIGPRERRPPYKGAWYPHSSNGWGILDFLDFCEAAGFLGVPDLNVNETPQDMADFIDCVNGPADGVWGAKRAAGGHPRPYGLKYMELGNEERVDANYFEKFRALAEAIWAKDPNMILVVGDFAYERIIKDPLNFTGAASGINTLAAQRQILQLAKQHNRAVWFDVHVWTDGPAPGPSLAGAFSFDNALGQLADGADYKVVIFELNAQNHAQRRALANALAINAAARDGRFPIVTSANGLQPDRQNDNGWDQGLLFLNPSQVWLQPPGWVTRMLSRHYEPLLVECEATGGLDAIATRSEDGKSLVLTVVNPGEKPALSTIAIGGYSAAASSAEVEELSAPLNASNPAGEPGRVQPAPQQWPARFENGAVKHDFAPHSFTVIKFN
ncbi:MAG TPA: hypothetical protein VGO59_05810 [Verrucomicrobiae bacterium]